MKSVETRYLGPTNYRGSRIKATDGDGNSITVSYDYGAHEPHDIAAQAFLDKMGWSGKWISGSSASGRGRVYVCVPEPMHYLKAGDDA